MVNTSNCQRISIVTETFAPEVNGVANTLEYLVRGLLAKGCDVQIIRPKQHKHDIAYHQDKIQHVTLTGIPIPGYKQLKFGLPLRRRVTKALQYFKPDVMYVATEGPLGYGALNAAKRLKLPVVSGFHTNFHQYIEHYHLGWLKPLVYRYLRYFHNRTLATLVPTQAQRQELSTYGIRSVQLLARGVDSELFHPDKRSLALRKSWGVQAQDLALLYVGRIAGEKNLTLALRTYERLVSLDRRVKLILVGDGPLLPSIQTNYPEVIIAGVKRGEELASYYASGDVFLFPSKTDTFGNVVTEAMASGLAVVSFDYAAAHEHIQHFYSGMLAPFADNERFIRAAETLLESPEQLKQFRQNARKQALTISWQNIVNDFLSHLQTVNQHTPEEVSHDAQQCHRTANKNRLSIS